MNDQTTVIPVYTVLPPFTLLMDIAGPMEVLRRANIEQGDVHFDYRYVAATTEQTTSIGLSLTGLEPLPASLPDGAWVIVSGNVTVPPSEENKAVEAESRILVSWLGKVVRPGTRLVTICSGALLAARAGLFDGRECTTHTLCIDELRGLAPTARVHDNRLYVEDRERFSSAGISTGTDLMLHLVSRATSPTIVLAIARYMVVYMRRSGSDPQLSPWFSGRNHVHPAIHGVQDAIMSEPARPWSVQTLADMAHMSDRHFSRLFHEHTGLSVPEYVNLMRVTLARDILANSRMDIEQVAERCGFGSPRQLRRAWSRHNDMPPSDFRRQQVR